jgi:hypothetical protein
MAIVIRSPDDERKKIYLDSVFETARKKYSIKCGTLTKDISIEIKNYKLSLKKGDYVIFYGDKREVVQNLGAELKKMGYSVLPLDNFTIGLLLTT